MKTKLEKELLEINARLAHENLRIYNKALDDLVKNYKDELNTEDTNFWDIENFIIHLNKVAKELKKNEK